MKGIKCTISAILAFGLTGLVGVDYAYAGTNTTLAPTPLNRRPTEVPTYPPTTPFPTVGEDTPEPTPGTPEPTPPPTFPQTPEPTPEPTDMPVEPPLVEPPTPCIPIGKSSKSAGKSGKSTGKSSKGEIDMSMDFVPCIDLSGKSGKGSKGSKGSKGGSGKSSKGHPYGINGKAGKGYNGHVDVGGYGDDYNGSEMDDYTGHNDGYGGNGHYHGSSKSSKGSYGSGKSSKSSGKSGKSSKGGKSSKSSKSRNVSNGIVHGQYEDDYNHNDKDVDDYSDELGSGSGSGNGDGEEEEIELFIIPSDSSLTSGNGGIINTIYDFELIAQNIPDNVSDVRFEWSPGFGAGGSQTDLVANGESSVGIQSSYPNPGTYEIKAFLYDDSNDSFLAETSIDVKIAGTVLTIDPPGLQDAEVDMPYTFNLEATEIPSGVDTVIFSWSFGVGSLGTGISNPIPVTNGMAITDAIHTYTAEGAYGIVAEVEDADTGTVLAVQSTTAFVGPTIIRNATLDECDSWSVSQAGGVGVTVDNWDISVIPTNAIFDIRFEAYEVPDKFLVEYPMGNLVLDTSWRGDESYAGVQYPGGIIEPGYGEEDGIFRRLTQDEFMVTVIGPDPGTEWYYEIRCRLEE